ncbi:F0F1 ATP synthase subunit delta [Sphaerotilus microaerophilus]|jgi:F-type H+-transporting ATPase subunit delta|uniref:ATP synthase subunit delta n=1 Tax=Sphaerotilus microaerophilus TaxID=2914710 RepID=A0ABM7YTN4_9BURK|nr:F0F1 ATP synthase subunit delta [Sphaerotilus sp. FB-5]BDI08017.1 ATP synthase subunit delta [Sphaerotilus sp. FB-5]
MAELATIARPYAEALYQVAQKADVASWGRQIQALAEVASNADLRQFADSPKISATQVYDVIASAVKMPLDAGVQNFLRTVIENGRLAALPAVAEQFQALANAASGVSDATIYSAFAIEPTQLADVVVSLERRFGRKLTAQVVLEPELIGGIRVVVGDEVLDTSVRARLERMKVALSA